MKTTPILIFIGALALLFSHIARADIAGFTIGASYWSPELSGDFNSDGDDRIDLSDDLDIGDPSHSSLVISIEHPIPLLPNIRYQSIDLDSDGRNRLSSSIRFDGETYAANETVRTRFDEAENSVVFTLGKVLVELHDPSLEAVQFVMIGENC